MEGSVKCVRDLIIKENLPKVHAVMKATSHKKKKEKKEVDPSLRSKDPCFRELRELTAALRDDDKIFTPKCIEPLTAEELSDFLKDVVGKLPKTMGEIDNMDVKPVIDQISNSTVMAKLTCEPLSPSEAESVSEDEKPRDVLEICRSLKDQLRKLSFKPVVLDPVKVDNIWILKMNNIIESLTDAKLEKQELKKIEREEQNKSFGMKIEKTAQMMDDFLASYEGSEMSVMSQNHRFDEKFMQELSELEKELAKHFQY